ncbi:HK97 family phage prohead protease [Sphingobium ummariense]|uniref:Uncharacterized protein n=1 Tax=Sphingobium ummariense RL-3 TaxID=1346791 RepID=T0K795_9SPHN|nr:hypothetical protein [Sphingobium ummariense]EQB32534.1 hypothetical protein M529_08880 [Sphingobium ummariense RL-3]
MTTQFLTKSFKAAPIRENEVEGLASTYGNIDHAGDIVERGAYARTLASLIHDARFRARSGHLLRLAVLRGRPASLAFVSPHSD